MLWFFALTELTRLSRPKCLCEENLWCSGSEKISLQTGRKSPLACPLLARPFFLASTTSKRLLRKLENLLHIDIAPMHEENSFRDFTLKNWTIRPPAINLSIKCQHIKFSLRISTWAYYVAFVKKKYLNSRWSKSARKQGDQLNFDRQLEWHQLRPEEIKTFQRKMRRVWVNSCWICCPFH